MKDIKQIRENFDLITEKEEKEGQKLTALVRAGLYDAKKLPALKKALDKSADKMTGQEKRMLLNLLDSLISQVTSDEQVYRKVRQNVHSMNEAKEDYLSKFDPRFKAGYPSDRDVPTVLILKRKAIRVYPDNQKVALYYSQALDKYVTIPFSDIQTGLNEAKKDDDDEPKGKVAGPRVQMRRKAIDAAHLLTNKGKYSSKLKRFTNLASKVGKAGAAGVMINDYFRKKAIQKALQDRPSKKKKAKSTSAPAAASSAPAKVSAAFQGSMQGKIGAMQRKSTVEESYLLKLQELREARQYGKADAALDAASFIPGPVGSAASLASAGMSLSRGDYAGAALDAASALPGVGYIAKAAKVAKLAKAAKAAKLSKGGKITDAARLARRNKALDRLKGRKGGKWKKRDIDIDVDTSSSSGSAPAQRSSNAPDTPSMPNYQFKASPEKYRAKGADADSTQRERERQLNRKSQQAMMKEDVLSTLRTMVNEDIKEQTVAINEQEININNTVAKKIVLVYESVSSKNKKKMEKMLNESAASFNKVLTFALRQ